jgi:lipase
MLSCDGVEIAVWDWPGGEPALVFAHATGFHGRCWDRVARMFPGRRRIAVEARGHGRSGKPDPPYRWPSFGRDLAAAAEALGLKAPIGVGHSMGGYAVAAAGRMFGALLLIDPTVFPRERYGSPPVDASFIRRRRNRWHSPAEMFERFRDRPPFASWQPDVLRDYCEFGLLPESAGFVLACPPEVEASIYEHSRDREADPYGTIASLAQPVTVLRAGVRPEPGKFNLGASPTAPDLASRFAQGRDVLLEGTSHYIPMESPGTIVEEIQKLTGRICPSC